MAGEVLTELGFESGNLNAPIILNANQERIELPDSGYIRDANLSRDGGDLILHGNQGEVRIEGYFDAAEAPMLYAPDGNALTPELVQSFAQSPLQFAASSSMSDASPIGLVSELSGDATLIRTDGSTAKIQLGTEIHQGDIIETAANGALNITFTDESSFAISEDSRLAIDEYVYDPLTEEGAQNFSVLKGLFVFTSGLVGRDDPDDVHIQTPSGSIGIRGTIIAGDCNTGEITVAEGAIVLRDFNGNEMTLAGQYETAKFGGAANGGIQNLGHLSASDMSGKFASIAKVTPSLFSSVNDNAGENVPPAQQAPQQNSGDESGANATPDASGSVDQNGDNQVDGTVQQNSTAPQAEATEQQQTLETAKPATTQTLSNSLSGNKLGETQLSSSLKGDGTKQTTQRGEIGDTAKTTVDNNTTKMGSTETKITNIADRPPPPPLNKETTTTTTTPDAGPAHYKTLHNEGVAIGRLHSFAPDGYFALTQNHNWSYNFDKEFTGGSNNTYQLSAATISELNTLMTNGEIADWSFEGGAGQHGRLSILGDQSAFTNTLLNISVRATNPAGASSTWKTYSIDFIDSSHSDSDIYLLNEPGGIDNATYSLTAASSPTIILGSTDNGFGSSNNTIFMDDKAHSITINDGTNNTVFMGTQVSGQNHIYLKEYVGNSITGNIIYGGDKTDIFDVYSLNNMMHGMDGDDTFILHINDGNEFDIANLGTNAGINGGWSGFIAGQYLRDNAGLDYNHGDSSGFGDTLRFLDTNGTIIDFSQIPDHYFRGIERIDMGDMTYDTDLRGISYEEIIAMTDQKNTLIFRGDTDDTITFTGLNTSNTQKVANDLSVQEADGMVNFDVYEIQGTQGKVTLLIEQNGSGNDALTTNGLVSA